MVSFRVAVNQVRFTALHAVVAVRNGAALGETMQNLNALTRRLNHFVDEMSRRPYRLLTGVRPLRPDSAQAGDSIVARREP